MRLKYLPAPSLVLLAALATAPASASATLLSNLIAPNQSLTFGSLQFSGFSYLATGDMPSDANVNVAAYTDGAGDVGLIFQGAFIDFVSGTGSDALIGFTVTELDPGKQLIGATLSGNPSVLGGSGSASVTETFLPTETGLALTIFDNSPGVTRLVDSGTFAVPATTVIVQKDLVAFSANVGGGIPTMSFVTQTFHETGSPIPEPAAVTLFGLGLIGLTLAMRRRPRRLARLMKGVGSD